MKRTGAIFLLVALLGGVTAACAQTAKEPDFTRTEDVTSI